MRPFSINPTSRLKGEIRLLGDKSIAHRSVIISAIAQGKTTIKNFPANKDCICTLKVFQRLGIRIKQDFKASTITVFGKGLYGLKRSSSPIFVGDSGTTLRLILGVLAGQHFKVRLIAGRSLSQRPMSRVATPLRMMGASIAASCKLQARSGEEYPPITITGGRIKSATFRMSVASAQVKSAILFAGLYAKNLTTVIEQIKTRDHTERMLKLFKADIKLKQNKILIRGKKELVSPGEITLPGDISSASFFIVLASILPNSEILIKNVNLNPSRIGILKVLKRMGADIKIQKAKLKNQNYEPMGDLLVKSSTLKGTVIRGDEVPSLIDELPILMVAASCARGSSAFEGISELRVKETDRIKSMSENLKKMGARVRVYKDKNKDKMVINGVEKLFGCRVRSFRDHRTAMSMIVAGLAASTQGSIDDITCINKSFPGFLGLFKGLIP